jgi:hypothetical protein
MLLQYVWYTPEFERFPEPVQVVFSTEVGSDDIRAPSEFTSSMIREISA